MDIIKILKIIAQILLMIAEEGVSKSVAVARMSAQYGVSESLLWKHLK
jgi:DNA-binding IscR family transcriptional regulator